MNVASSSLLVTQHIFVFLQLSPNPFTLVLSRRPDEPLEADAPGQAVDPGRRIAGISVLLTLPFIGNATYSLH
jgi:hypothetical protein